MAFRFLVLLLVAVGPGWCWGTSGHRIVAMIAEQRLSARAKAQVRHLLFDGQYSMADVSTCADALRLAEREPLRPEEQYCLKVAGTLPKNSGPWHYIDIPVPEAPQPLMSYCPENNCVVAKIQAFRDILKTSHDDAERRAAVLYLIHFVGDIHQPLHCSERSCGQGGNLERVNFYWKHQEQADRNLHSVWDTALIVTLILDGHVENEQPYAARLAQQIKPSRAAAWAASSVQDMAWEGWKLAKEYSYAGIPSENFCDPAVKSAQHAASDLSTAYEKQARRVVREQLVKAGVRLAAILEQSL